ncbi:MAG: catalase [Oscillospiraceae bacterium]|nr:catalase [Oscillospiraceae bacterium]
MNGQTSNEELINRYMRQMQSMYNIANRGSSAPEPYLHNLRREGVVEPREEAPAAQIEPIAVETEAQNEYAGIIPAQSVSAPGEAAGETAAAGAAANEDMPEAPVIANIAENVNFSPIPDMFKQEYYDTFAADETKDESVSVSSQNIMPPGGSRMPMQNVDTNADMSSQAGQPAPNPYSLISNPSNMTDSFGRPVYNDDNSLTVGRSGPTLLQDTLFVEKLAHFDRERIPERVVHAKGAGAHGYFRPYGCMGPWTKADFLSSPDKITPVFVRFSVVIGSKGSPDTARDPRGFAVKFYTQQGIYDITGNNLPVFFIRDAIKFPDLIHSLKPAPNTNVVDPERFWDFASMSPEATHMVTWVYSDRGTVKNFAKMDGFGVNTYVWVNAAGERLYIKYHFKTMQGIETIDRHEAVWLAGENPDIAVKTLYDDLASGKKIRYELCVQMMHPDEAGALDFDPLDATKVWAEEKYPLIKVGMMTLDRNPANFFAEVEQSAFCPGNIVPGVEFSADKMLQGRTFSYLDTQRHRIGPNFMDLPINKPVNPVSNNQRDGSMTYFFNPEPINYSPNSLNNNMPRACTEMTPKPVFMEGMAAREPIDRADDFRQAGERYHSLSQIDKDHLVDNIACELHCVRNDIKERMLNHFRMASPEFCERVRAAMNVYGRI